MRDYSLIIIIIIIISFFKFNPLISDEIKQETAVWWTEGS